MPIVVGAKPESRFTDPIGLLTDCHCRIERFLSTLLQVSRAARGEAALRCFREAAPKHMADEERTVFPRLRQMNRPEVKALLARVESLEDYHVRATESHAEVDRVGQAWLACGTISGSEDLYRAHIAVEEGDVFPVAAKSLTAREREAMGGEMAERRGLSRIG